MSFIKKAKKFFVKKALLSSIDRSYSNTPALVESLKPMKSEFLLVTIVFNDAELIALQYRSLQERLKDAYDYCVIDDSSDEEQARAIESFCKEKNVSYIHLPKTNPGLDGSMCHGLALNWTFRNVVKKISPRYVGFLDPDIILFAPGSFLDPWHGKLFWGMRGPSQSPGLNKEQQEKYWRLWPGFCFFSRDFYQQNELNFLPVKNIDTGGRNFPLLHKLDASHLIPWSAVKEERIDDDGKETVQRFANVIHLVGGVSMKKANKAGIQKKREFAYTIISP